MPRDFKRTDRISDVIQKALAMIIQQEMRDPKLGMVTILEVTVSKDLVHAKIYVNVFPDELAIDSVNMLNKAAGFMRGLLAKQLELRVIPHLRFIYDETTLKANKLSKLIDNACRSNKKDDQ